MNQLELFSQKTCTSAYLEARRHWDLINWEPRAGEYARVEFGHYFSGHGWDPVEPAAGYTHGITCALLIEERADHTWLVESACDTYRGDRGRRYLVQPDCLTWIPPAQRWMIPRVAA
jgi:hypothetical protein